MGSAWAAVAERPIAAKIAMYFIGVFLRVVV
jgi:hypothetical protein